MKLSEMDELLEMTGVFVKQGGERRFWWNVGEDWARSQSPGAFVRRAERNLLTLETGLVLTLEEGPSFSSRKRGFGGISGRRLDVNRRICYDRIFHHYSCFVPTF